MNIGAEFARRPFHVSYMAKTAKQLLKTSLAIKRIENFWTLGSASYKDRKLYTKHEYEELVAYKNAVVIGKQINENIKAKLQVLQMYRDVGAIDVGSRRNG